MINPTIQEICSKYWVHWQYSKKDRNRIAQAELLFGFWVFLLCCVVGLSVMVIIWLGNWSVGSKGGVPFGTTRDYPLQTYVVWGLGIGGVGGALVLIAKLLNFAKFVRKIEDVYIGSAGMYLNRKCIGWNNSSSRLASVQIQSGNISYLDFSFQKKTLKPGQVETESYQVPIPLGKEAEAQEVVNRLCNK
jgi:hypothetical protein